MGYIISLLKSKNPVMSSIGVLLAFLMLLWLGVGLVNSANTYIDKFETKEDHRADIKSAETNFKKDVRIALLENNKALLEEIDKRMRR